MSAQILKAVLDKTGVRQHMPTPTVITFTQGASLGYMEVAGDISCPLIQGLLKSVRMLPLKPLQAGLVTYLFFSLLCIAPV